MVIDTICHSGDGCDIICHPVDIFCHSDWLKECSVTNPLKRIDSEYQFASCSLIYIYTTHTAFAFYSITRQPAPSNVASTLLTLRFLAFPTLSSTGFPCPNRGGRSARTQPARSMGEDKATTAPRMMSLDALPLGNQFAD